jgi:hypothetical protein
MCQTLVRLSRNTNVPISSSAHMDIKKLVKISTPCHKTVFERMDRAAQDAMLFLKYVLFQQLCRFLSILFVIE